MADEETALKEGKQGSSGLIWKLVGVIAILPVPVAAALATSTFFLQPALSSNEATAQIVEGHKARFKNMGDELHSYRTRNELNDPLVKQSIQRQIVDKANQILRHLQAEPNPANRIAAVFHDQLGVRDSTPS